MFVARAWVMASVLLLTAACGGPDGGGDGAGQEKPLSNSASANPETTSKPDAGSSGDKRRAQRALKRSIEPMIDEPVTGFTVVTRLMEVPSIELEGFADARSGEWAATAVFTDPAEGTTVGRVLTQSTGGRVIMQMEEWDEPRAGCWLRMSPTQVPLGIAALVPVEPIYVTLLGYLHATGFADNSRNVVEGSLDMQVAMRLLTGRLLEQIDLDEAKSPDARAPVEVALAGGRVERLKLAGSSLAAALEDAGGSIGDMAASALDSMDVEITYREAGGDDIVAEPDPSLLFDDGDKAGCAA